MDARSATTRFLLVPVCLWALCSVIIASVSFMFLGRSSAGIDNIAASSRLECVLTIAAAFSHRVDLFEWALFRRNG